MEDPAITACRERCAQYGEPSCAEVLREQGKPFAPCDECLREIGCPVDEPLDPNAAVRPLL